MKIFFFSNQNSFLKRTRDTWPWGAFGLEDPGSIPDTAKNPPSKCGVLARKIRGSESPVVGRQQFTMGVVSGKNLLPFQRHIKIEEVDDGWCCHLSYNEAEIGLLLLKNRPTNSEVTYPLCLKPYTGLGLTSGTRQQMNFLVLN